MGLTPELLHRMKGECVRKVEERFALAEGRGEMVLTEEESRVRTWVRIPNDGRGLYKAYLLGRGGRFLLGTLVPEDGALALRRTVSRGELERRGFWPNWPFRSKRAGRFRPPAGGERSARSG